MQEVYTPKIETKPKIEINIIDRSFLSDIRFKIKHFEDLIKPVIIRADTDKNIPPKSEYLGQAHLNAVMNGEEFNYLFYQELANDVGVINYLDFINEDKAPYYLKKYTQLKKNLQHALEKNSSKEKEDLINSIELIISKIKSFQSI